MSAKLIKDAREIIALESKCDSPRQISVLPTNGKSVGEGKHETRRGGARPKRLSRFEFGVLRRVGHYVFAKARKGQKAIKENSDFASIDEGKRTQRLDNANQLIL